MSQHASPVETELCTAQPQPVLSVTPVLARTAEYFFGLIGLCFDLVLAALHCSPKLFENHAFRRKYFRLKLRLAERKILYLGPLMVTFLFTTLRPPLLDIISIFLTPYPHCPSPGLINIISVIHNWRNNINHYDPE